MAQFAYRTNVSRSAAESFLLAKRRTMQSSAHDEHLDRRKWKVLRTHVFFLWYAIVLNILLKNGLPSAWYFTRVVKYTNGMATMNIARKVLV